MAASHGQERRADWRDVLITLLRHSSASYRTRSFGQQALGRTAMALASTAAPRRWSRTQHADREVAAKVRERRLQLGLKQRDVAEQLGISYQQAHKYETGVLRISVGRLFQIAKVLDVEVSYFFRDLAKPRPTEGWDRRRAMLELARNFAHLPSQCHQEALCQLARAMADEVLPLAIDLDEVVRTTTPH
jgi:transcriptional regulator with XRE-family HTH domain